MGHYSFQKSKNIKKKKMFDNIKMARIKFLDYVELSLRIVFDKYESKLFDESMNKKKLCERKLIGMWVNWVLN